MKSLFRYLNQLLQHRTFHNVGYLAIGNFIAQLISLIGAFYVPKLLGPEKYGSYNTIIAYVSLFTILTFSGLNKVIIREAARDLQKTKEILENTIGLRNLFSLLSSLVCVIIVLFINYDFGTKLYIVIFSTSLLLSGLQSSINTIYQSFEKMKVLAVLSVTQQLIRVPISIFLLKNGYGVLELILLQLIIQLSTLIFNYHISKRIVKFDFFSKIVINKNYLFPGLRFSLLEFLNVLSGKIDLVMLSILTTPQNVGLYAFAYRLVEKGLVLREPVSQSIFPYYAKKFAGKNVNINELVKHTAIISIPLLIILLPAIIFIKPIIIGLAGNEFSSSANIFSILVLYLIFNFSVIPWGLALQTTNNEQYSIIIVLICALINIGLNIIFFKNYGVIGIAYSTLFVEFLRLLGVLFYVFRISARNIS